MQYAFALSLLLLPAAASAQLVGAVTDLFDSVNSIAFAVNAGPVVHDTELDPECLGGALCGMTIEVFLDLPAPEGTTLELGLGTSFLRGLSSDVPTLDFRGAVRTLPVLSVYATRSSLGSGRWQPYAGLNFGFAQLWNVRAYDPDGVQYEASGEAFEYGGTLGVYISTPPVTGLFVEASLRQRRFDSLAWRLPGDALPADWPRALNASTFLVSVGWQFRLVEDA